MSSLSRSAGQELEGILLVDKPQGPTSHDIVSKLRRKLQMKRIGHAGTLDPMATGLLIMLIGKATKASQFLIGQDKAYQGTLELGKTTDSQDADGEVVEEKPVPNLTEAQLLEYMTGFLGDQYQIPPMFSAKKIDGVPLYKLARKGETIEREPRFIHVRRFALQEFNLPDVRFDLISSKGTYVRTIVHDLGQRIGCGAFLKQLRRTGSGDLSIEQAHTLEEIEASSIADIRRMLLPVYQVIPSYLL
jgi:tRNA pseudouridine55 synthase